MTDPTMHPFQSMADRRFAAFVDGKLVEAIAGISAMGRGGPRKKTLSYRPSNRVHPWDDLRIASTDRPEPVEGPPAPPLAARARLLPGAATPHADRLDRPAPGRFLGHLAETGSVSAACARAGMSRNSAYKLRRKTSAESFAAAWDAAIGMPVRRVTIGDLHFLAYHGLVKPLFRGGKYLRSQRQPDNSALLKLMARLDRLTARIEGHG
jgi:hypothetical protein